MAKTSSRKNHKGKPKRKPTAAKRGISWWTVGVVALVLVAVGVLGYGIWSQPGAPEDADIDGVVDYQAKKAEWFDDRDHKTGPLDYATTPPAGGDHNAAWQTCTGVVYDEPIPDEHAVHSLEHGAVWITHEPGLAEAELSKLSKKVDGRDYTLMSPYEGQKSPISLQAWGYQLRLDSADDDRIDEFLATYRVSASQEPGATCSGGVSATGDKPVDQPDEH